MITLEKRAGPSKAWALATPLVAVALTMIVGGILFAALGKNPFETIRTIFLDPLFSEFAWFYRPQLLIKGAPLVLIAIGLSFGFRAGVWNIGAEGQYIMGAICGAAVGLAFHPMESRLIFPLMVLAGAFGGWAWAMIPGVLRVKFGTNEILVSLMLVYVAEQLLASMALGAMRNPDGMGFPGSRNLAQYPSAANLELIKDDRDECRDDAPVHAGIFDQFKVGGGWVLRQVPAARKSHAFGVAHCSQRHRCQQLLGHIDQHERYQNLVCAEFHP